MAYQNASPNYRIPYMSQGELSSGSGNRRAALISDSQLQGTARLIGGNGIIGEGAYTATFSSGNNSSVIVAANAPNYAMEAYINGVYVAQNTTLSWTGLPDNSTIYLYAQTQENNLYQSSEFSSLAYKQVAAIFNTNGLTPVNAILIGIATTTGVAISLNTSSTISDSSFSQRPILYPYNQHRTANPIDHPFHSIFNIHLTDDIIRSNNIHPWDGQTSGTGVYSILSGTGIASNMLKPQSVDSRSLAPSIAPSGVTIQNTLLTLHGEVSTLSGTTLLPGYTGQNILEAVPLQVLQNNLSGFSSNAFSQTLANNESGLDTRTQYIQGHLPVQIGLALSDETTQLTVANSVVTFRSPCSFILGSAKASLTSSSINSGTTINILQSGISVLGKVITIGSGLKTSVSSAIQQPTIVNPTILNDAEFTVDINSAGTGAAGAKIWLIGTTPNILN